MSPTNFAGLQIRSASTEAGNTLGGSTLIIIIAVAALFLVILAGFFINYVYRRIREKKRATTSQQKGSKNPLLNRYVEDDVDVIEYYPAYLPHSKTYPYSMNHGNEDFLDRPSEIHTPSNKDDSFVPPTLHYSDDTSQTPLRPVLSPLRISNSQQIHHALPPKSSENAVLDLIINAAPFKPTPSSPTSSISLYSQTSQSAASSPPNTPPIAYLPPLTSQTGNNVDEFALQRGETLIVSNLLMARANRNPDGLLRSSTKVSHIERTGSIKSIEAIHDNHRSYARRYLSKGRKSSMNNVVTKEDL